MSYKVRPKKSHPTKGAVKKVYDELLKLPIGSFLSPDYANANIHSLMQLNAGYSIRIVKYNRLQGAWQRVLEEYDYKNNCYKEEEKVKRSKDQIISAMYTLLEELKTI
jgi:hypothetical protein